ncbi:MAG: TfoX/Sxy family protein [Ruminiclostridium sp.]
MATTKEYLNYIEEQLSHIEGISYKAMMGEYLIYYKDRVAGGICDNRLLVKPVKAAIALMPSAPQELPYEGAKPMLLVSEIENREFTQRLFEAMYDELSLPKKKK